MSDFLAHGRILGGTATTPDLDAALGDYRDALGLRVVERGTVSDDLAASWGCPAVTGARFAALQPTSGTPCSLGLEEGGSYVIPYTMISRAFGLDDDTLHGLSMAQHGRMPIVEIDDYPAQATARGHGAGMLPPGNAMVTLAVDRLDGRGLAFATSPAVRDGPVYGGRRSATVRGHAGELLELIEIG